MNDNKVNKSPPINPPFFYGYIIVTAATLIMVVTFGAYQSFGILLKPILAEFGWTRATISGAYSLSWIISGLLSIAMGGLNDKFGPRTVMTICGICSGLGYLLLSRTGTVWQLYLFYAILIGTGISIFVPLLSTITRWFVRRRTIMSGIVSTGIGIGVLTGPLLTSFLISVYDWRVTYMILGITVLVVVTISAQFLRRDPAQVGQTAYGEIETVEEKGQTGNRSFTLKEAVYTSQFWIIFAIFFALGFCMLLIAVHIAPYATDIGISTTSAATILAVSGGASIISRVFLGNLGDKYGNKRGALIGFVLMLLALIWLLPAGVSWQLYLFALIFGIAYGDIVPQQSPLVASIFGLASHGLIFGVVDLGFTIGAAVGPFIAGYTFDVAGSYHMAFIISAVVSFIGLLLTAILRSPRKGEKI